MANIVVDTTDQTQGNKIQIIKKIINNRFQIGQTRLINKFFMVMAKEEPPQCIVSGVIS